MEIYSQILINSMATLTRTYKFYSHIYGIWVELGIYIDMDVVLSRLHIGHKESCLAYAVMPEFV